LTVAASSLSASARADRFDKPIADLFVDRKDRDCQQLGIAAPSQREKPEQRVQRCDESQMNPVNNGDDASGRPAPTIFRSPAG
jgi:hypothetical protein